MKSCFLFLCSILIPATGLGLEVKSEQIGSQRYAVAMVNPRQDRMGLYWKSSDGQILGGFDNLKQELGVRKDGQVVLVISDTRVSFYSLATAFRDHWQCPNALFLDGIISSIHAPNLQRNDSNHELGPILAVVGAAPP